MAASKYVLSVDIGTSSLKAACISLDGQVSAFARTPYAPKTPGGIVEAGDWERALFLAIGSLSTQAPEVKPAAICISGNGPTLAPVTASGASLAPLHWFGAAAAPSGRSFFLPHVVRFREERPGDYEKTARFLSAQEWLSWRLGADPVTVLPSAAYEPYYWDDAQCAALALDRGKFAPFVQMGSVIGRIASPSAAAWALPQGIPIIAGGPDFSMALIGVGAIEPGLVCDRAGSSEGINVCCTASAAEELTAISTGALRILPHVREGFWNVGAVLPASGSLFEWFRTISGQDSRDYEAVMGEIGVLADTRLSAAGALAWSAKAVAAPLTPSPDGAFLFPAIGGTAGGSALVSSRGLPGRAELGLAVLESIGCMVRDAIAALEQRGFPVRELRLSGGQAKSPCWNQLKADMIGRTLLVPELCDGELAGDACVSAIALGEAADLTQAVQRIVRLKDRAVPRSGAAAFYDERYARYKELKAKAGGLW
ncbi:sugar kinase [Spirochaetia bacterium]|nr:sugar kinase [Spirochaetia bacterium]